MDNSKQKEQKNMIGLKPSSYAHFDGRVKLDSIWTYINDPQKVKRHSFYPFIHYIQEYRKYDGKRVKFKKRRIFYASHIDKYIYQLYSYKLNKLYNQRVKKDGLDDTAIAYRADYKDNNNIYFARRAFNFIKKNDCFIIVGDFKDFFDKLDHKYLKKRICDLINTNCLPDDHYAVFKSISRYAYIELDSILKHSGFYSTKRAIKKFNMKRRALSPKDFQLFRDRIKRNENNYGIPQGAPISSVYSNIYMLQFDKIINIYIKSLNGLYMRYSDDFIIVLPHINETEFLKHYMYLTGEIEKIPNVELQKDKTEVFSYSNGILLNMNSLISETEKSRTLDYLGFSFDGKKICIRDKTISKYYYKTYRKIKNIKKLDPNGEDSKKKIKKLYSSQSISGAFPKIKSGPARTKKALYGNFITYVFKAKRIFGPEEHFQAIIENHQAKIHNKLKTASPCKSLSPPSSSIS